MSQKAYRAIAFQLNRIRTQVISIRNSIRNAIIALVLMRLVSRSLSILSFRIRWLGLGVGLVVVSLELLLISVVAMAWNWIGIHTTSQIFRNGKRSSSQTTFQLVLLAGSLIQPIVEGTGHVTV